MVNGFSFSIILKARFHYERGIEHSLFLLLIFPRLKSKRALSKAKKSRKQTKNAPFHARSGNEPQEQCHLEFSTPLRATHGSKVEGEKQTKSNQ